MDLISSSERGHCPISPSNNNQIIMLVCNVSPFGLIQANTNYTCTQQKLAVTGKWQEYWRMFAPILHASYSYLQQYYNIFICARLVTWVWTFFFCTTTSEMDWACIQELTTHSAVGFWEESKKLKSTSYLPPSYQVEPSHNPFRANMSEYERIIIVRIYHVLGTRILCWHNLEHNQT